MGTGKEKGRFATALEELVNAAVADPIGAGATILGLSRRLLAAPGPRVAGIEQEVLTYREALHFFVTNKAKAERSRAGAILRERQGGRQLVRLLFLDAESEVIESAPKAAYLVESLDDELDQAFGVHDLVVVK